ncbi:MAG: uroporphyrinogen-III synthase [Pseudomonadota bacterium]
MSAPDRSADSRSRRVLVTREEASARRTASLLAERGHTAVVAPLTDIQALHDGLLKLGRALEASPRGLIAVTSAAALEAVLAAAQREVLPFASLTKRRYGVVGGRAASLCEANGFRLLVPPAETVDALIATLAPLSADQWHKALYACARDRTASLERAYPALRAIEVYEAIARSGLDDDVVRLLRREPVDTALAYSARSARLALDALRKAGLDTLLSNLRWVCLSPAVEAELRADGVSAGYTRTSEKPNENSLLNAIDEF